MREEMRRQQEKLISDANEFLKQQGIDSAIQSFWESHCAQKIVERVFREMANRFAWLVSGAPDELKERGEKSYETFAGEKGKKAFFADALNSMKVRIYCNYMVFKNAPGLFDKEVLQKAFSFDEEELKAVGEGQKMPSQELKVMITSLRAICQDMMETHDIEFVHILYHGTDIRRIPADVRVGLFRGGLVMAVLEVPEEFAATGNADILS